MRRVLVILGVLVTLLMPAPPALAGSGEQPPAQCQVSKDGVLPTCYQDDDGNWQVEYPDNGRGGGGGGIAAIFLLISMTVMGVVVWRLAVTHRAETAAWPNVREDK